MIPQNLNERFQALTLPITVSESKNLPCIILRRRIEDKEVLKVIVSCALHQQPIICLPIFSNPIKSMSTLIEKGIIYREKDQLYFTF